MSQRDSMIVARHEVPGVMRKINFVSTTNISGTDQNGTKIREHLGRFIAPEGLEDSAQGFNPGNRPAGRRALKGRQIRRVRTDAKNIFTYLYRDRNRSTSRRYALY